MIKSLGKVTVAVAGTPEAITKNWTATTRRCHSFLVEVLPTNTGKVYVGDKNLNKSTLAGVFAILAIPTTNLLPSFSATLSYAPDAFDAGDIFLDVDVSGEGAVCSVVRG